MDVPILSIAYSLTPKAPFPHALEEVLYVYGWVLKTSGKQIGSTAENIIFVGDSAGANLSAALIVKCIELGLPVPKGFLGIYALFLSNYASIPSRMLGMFDIVLNYQHSMRIFRAYAGFFTKREPVVDGEIPVAPSNGFDDEIPYSPLISPILASDEILRQFPDTAILTTDLDPCLDEDVEMAKKLRASNVNVKLVVLPGLVHGFLHGARVRVENN
jgi:hormone-sensitive lipase